jgi:CRP-like cAMP-binding protein
MGCANVKKIRQSGAARGPDNRLDASPDLRLLAGTPLFNGFDDSGLKAMSAAAKRMRVDAGAVLFEQGEPADRFFVLERGRVKVAQITPEGHQVVLRYVGAGDMFGCVSLYGREEYPASATAATRSEVLAWDCHATQRLMEQHPRLAINALKLLGKELAETRARYRELATERVEQRVARALGRLVRQSGKRVEGGVQVGFPVSRQDLAELTGTTLHTVSRILSDWERQGIVESGRRRIVIRKPHDLVMLAEDLDAGAPDSAE